MKKNFQEFYHSTFARQTVNEQAYQVLRSQLFAQAKPTPVHIVPWWHKLLLPVSLSTAGLALFFGIFYWSQRTPSFVPGVFNPKVALAQALDYTFGKDSFIQSFGLGDPYAFRHRQFIISTPTQSHDAIIDVWGYQGNARLDYTSIHHKKNHTGHTFISQFDQRYCYETNTAERAKYKERCPSLQAEIEAQTELALQGQTFLSTAFSPEANQTLVQWIEAQPSTRQVDLGNMVLHYPTIQIRFATQHPLIDPIKIAYYSIDGIGGYPQIYDSNRTPGSYFNRLEDGLYWHSTPTEQSMYDNGVFFIQFISGDQVTPIYEYHAVDDSLTALDYATLTKHIQDNLLQQDFMQRLYRNDLAPAYYLITHWADFAEPIEQTEEIKNNRPTVRLRFSLPTSYFTEVMGGIASGSALMDPMKYIDVWFDPTTNQIVGYRLLKADQSTVYEVTITVDETITEISPDTFFTMSYWQAAVGLAADDITDEPYHSIQPSGATFSGLLPK